MADPDPTVPVAPAPPLGDDVPPLVADLERTAADLAAAQRDLADLRADYQRVTKELSEANGKAADLEALAAEQTRSLEAAKRPGVSAVAVRDLLSAADAYMSTTRDQAVSNYRGYRARRDAVIKMIAEALGDSPG